MLRTFSCFAVLFLLGSTVASAQVTLEVKYPEGTKYTVQKEGKTTQTLTLAGMNIDTKSTTFGTTTTQIGKRAADGSLDIEQKVDSLQTETSLPGGLMLRFDSANPDKKADIPQLEPILEALRVTFRLPVTAVLDSKNKISRVSLPEGEFEKLSESVKDRFKPEWLKKAADRSISVLPDGPVKKGDTWDRFHEINIGDGQVMSFNTKYEYAGTIEQDGKMLDKIIGKALDVSYTADGNPVIQVKNSEMKVIDSVNTYLFDRGLGAMLSHSSKINIAGPVTLVINGTELAGKVDLTMEESETRQK